MADNVAGALCYVFGLITGVLFLALAPYNQSKFVRSSTWLGLRCGSSR
jgi:uncharacterized membrane protein